MEINPLVKLTQEIRKFKIIKHLKRQMFSTGLVGAMIKGLSAIFSELADKIESEATAELIERRIYLCTKCSS